MLKFRLIGKLFTLDPVELQVAKSLWILDPMNTCCHVNMGMDDEYWCEAKMLTLLIRQGITLTVAIQETFDYYFWPDALKPEAFSEMIAELSRISFSAQPP